MYDGFELNKYLINYPKREGLGDAFVRIHITDSYVDELEQLKSSSSSEIEISGLNQQSFEYFISNYACKFRVIGIIHCPNISDFSCLARLENIEYLLIDWNTKAQQLWDMSRNLKLRGLYLNETKKILSFSEVSTAPALEELILNEGVNSMLSPKSWKIDTLKGLPTHLKRLQITLSGVIDNDITPLLLMKCLDKLCLITSLFSLEDFAKLNGSLLNTEIYPNKPFYTTEDDDYALVIGKNRNVKKNSKKLIAYQKQWDAHFSNKV